MDLQLPPGNLLDNRKCYLGGILAWHLLGCGFLGLLLHGRTLGSFRHSLRDMRVRADSLATRFMHRARGCVLI